MTRNRLFFLSILLSAYATNASATDTFWQTGKWEIERKLEGPHGKPKIEKVTKCIRKEDIGDDPIAPLLNEKSDCKVLKQDRKENTVDFEMACKGENGGGMTKAKGNLKREGELITGSYAITVAIFNKVLTFQEKWEAKRLSPSCD